MDNFGVLTLRKFFKYTQWGHDELDIPRRSVIHFGTNMLQNAEVLCEMFDEFEIVEYPETVTDFYRKLGYDDIVVVEPSEAEIGSPLKGQKKFDLVVNMYASGKTMNQTQVFQNFYDLCEENGHIVHVFPYYRWSDNHFFSYQPNFIFKLKEQFPMNTMGAWMSREDPKGMCMYMPAPPTRDDIYVEYDVENQGYNVSISYLAEKTEPENA